MKKPNGFTPIVDFGNAPHSAAKSLPKCTTGFIALISILIISAVLLVVVVGGSLAGLYARADTLEAEDAAESQALADACADTVRLRIGSNPLYAGNETIVVGNESCRIFGTTGTSSSTRTFVVQGVYRHAYATYIFAINPETLARSSWQELPTYP